MIALTELRNIELEGPTHEISYLEKKLRPALGEQETRNYRDIFIAYKRSQGIEVYGIEGPTFTGNDEEIQPSP